MEKRQYYILLLESGRHKMKRRPRKGGNLSRFRLDDIGVTENYVGTETHK
jgi:hypothetical protein